MLGEIVRILVDKFQPSEDFLQFIQKKDPNIYQNIGKLYANYPGDNITQALKSISKNLLLLKPKDKDNINTLLGRAMMSLFQEYPLGENHTDASEANITKAKKMGSLPLYISLQRGGILGFGDFLSYFADNDNVDCGPCRFFTSLDDVLDLIKSKPENVDLVLTGNYAKEEVIEAADLVTEMKEIKHPFQKGIKAKEGIDF